jgi:hypothetical protein
MRIFPTTPCVHAVVHGALVLGLLLVLACGSRSDPTPASVATNRADVSIATPSLPTSTPTTVPTPTPGRGVAVRGVRWEVTVTKIEMMHEWNSLRPTSRGKVTPIIVVLDVTFRNLDASQETIVEPAALALVGSDGARLGPGAFSLPATGGGVTHYLFPDGTRSDSPSKGIMGFNRAVPLIGDGDLIRAQYGFAVSADIASGPLRLRFHDVEIPVSDQAPGTPSPSPLPR